MKYIMIIAVAFAVMLLLDYTSNENGAGEEKESSVLEQVKRDKVWAELDQVCNEVDRRLQYACLYGNGAAMRTYSPIAYRLAEIRRQMLNHPLTGQSDPMMFRDEIREIRNSLKH